MSQVEPGIPQPTHHLPPEKWEESGLTSHRSFILRSSDMGLGQGRGCGQFLFSLPTASD